MGSTSAPAFPGASRSPARSPPAARTARRLRRPVPTCRWRSRRSRKPGTSRRSIWSTSAGTNSSRPTPPAAAVHLTYRVVGTSETGGITLPPGPTEDPGHSETEMEASSAARRAVPGRPACRRAGAISSGLRRSMRRQSSHRPRRRNRGAGPPPSRGPRCRFTLSLTAGRSGALLGTHRSAQIWDPSTGEFTEVASPSELFCSGHSLLPDGRVMVSGGHISADRGIADISIFSPATGSWTQSTPMRRGRWYPTNTTLANGSVVILAGRDEVGDEVAEPEVWSPSGIRQLTDASLVLPYYPRTFVAPNGRCSMRASSRPRAT